MRVIGIYYSKPSDVDEITEALDDRGQLIHLVARAVQPAAT
jgi:hypothetical protein